MLSVIGLVLVATQAAAPPQAAPGRQAIFDRATAAADEGKCAEAVRDFAALEADTSRKMGPAVAATVGIRKGVCLIRLERGEEGEAALRSGIVTLSPLGAAHAGDVRLAYLTLGRAAYARYDYAQSTHQLDQARAAFVQTGLDEAQCALIAPSPAMRRSGASSSDYPMEAYRMGFEGWVRTEFDIQADGRTASQRAIISYPPFVFEDAATGVAKGMRYEATYRPSGGAACNGQQQQIVFERP